MSERFFVASPIAGTRAELSGDEARHLVSVMRAKVGDEVTLFDGCGAEFVARIEAIRKQAVELSIVTRSKIDRELPFALTLAVALPKGDRQKWLVEKATELGVTRLVPLMTERGVAQPVEAAIERLRRTAIEAAKQSGRNRLLEIGPPVAVLDFFAATSTADLRLVADPAGEQLATIELPASDLAAAIGPEGGFTPGELAAAQSAGWRSISLGPRILRVETAAIALAAWAALGQPHCK
jgi:16S rRNA (uracil1498-N3)-methyltransferase